MELLKNGGGLALLAAGPLLLVLAFKLHVPAALALLTLWGLAVDMSTQSPTCSEGVDTSTRPAK